jgi:predicted glutamine amidotransferase
MHDGWGVAFYQEADVALFREPTAAADSELVRYLEAHGPATDLAISHIRHATQGAIALANTQPFVRELAGRTHCFAHNGDLKGIADNALFATGDGYRPVGQTDSEYAFCALLARLSRLWSGEPPTVKARQAAVAQFAVELTQLGPANFLYADSDVLFAHGHRRMQAATGHAGPPGLWTLQRHCKPGQAQPEKQGGLAVNEGERSVVFVASVPLTDEPWRPLAEGELIMVRHGEYVTT